MSIALRHSARVVGHIIYAAHLSRPREFHNCLQKSLGVQQGNLEQHVDSVRITFKRIQFMKMATMISVLQATRRSDLHVVPTHHNQMHNQNVNVPPARHLIPNLKPFTNYSVRVACLSSQGISPWSPWVTLHTSEGGKTHPPPLFFLSAVHLRTMSYSNTVSIILVHSFDFIPVQFIHSSIRSSIHLQATLPVHGHIFVQFSLNLFVSVYSDYYIRST